MKKVFLFALFSAVLILGPLVGSPASAQDNYEDPVVAYNKGVSSVQLQQWDKGLEAVNIAIQTHRQNASTKFGPVFGHFYYIKGLLLLGKEDLPGAIEAFKVCYNEYTNDIFDSAPTEETSNLRPNIFRIAALEQWANCEMKSNSFGEAARLYEKVLEEGKDDPKVNKVFVGVNLGRCYLKDGQLEKGYDYMIRPLESRSMSDGLRETIFMVIAEDWSPATEFSKVREFIQQFSVEVDADPFEERYQRNPRFQFLAQTAITEGEPLRALAWYERMIDPRLLEASFKKRHQALEARRVGEDLKAAKEAKLKTYAEDIDGLSKNYLNILNGVGTSHFMMQNYPAVYIAFSRLSDQSGQAHPQRPIYLHNAVVSAVQIERWRDAYHYGKQFLSEFPDHELKPSVARVLVEVLFLREEYQESYSVSGDVREDMALGDPIRDIPDFVFGASAFHLGHFEEAEAELSAYLANYPDGTRTELTRFFLGLTKVRLQKWEDAAAVLNSFLVDYPQSAMTSTILYQCALSEFMIDQSIEALAKVERVHEEFPSAEVIAPSWNLKGDLANSLGHSFEEIESSYLNGLKFGETAGQSETAEYALWQLIIQTSDAEDWEKSQAHYKAFQEKYADSIFRHEVTAASLPLLVEAGNLEEGLDRLRDSIWENQNDPTSVTLSEMFGTYVDYLRENFEHEERLKELDALSKRRGITPCLSSWVTVAKADFLEENEADAELVNQQFYLLEAGFKPEQESNYPIVRLARWKMHVRNRPLEARELYEYVLDNRPGTANYNDCLIDVADIEASSDDPAMIASAKERFGIVLNDFLSEELRERAVLGLARLATVEKDFEAAQGWWLKYLETREWTLSRAEANYQLGYSYEKLGNPADALKVYVSVYANFPGYVDWSTRAYLRTAAIIKGQGEDLKALKVLQDMLKRMGHIEHPGIEAGKNLFVKWRKEYLEATAVEG